MDALNFKSEDKMFENVYKNIPGWMRIELRMETKLGKIIFEKIERYIMIEFTTRFIIFYVERNTEELIIETENDNDFSLTPNVALPRPDRHSGNKK